MTVKLRLAPTTVDEEVLEPDDGMPKLVSGDFNKTHTGISDWRIRHSYDPGLFDRHLLDEIWLEKDDGTLLFRGYLKAGENNQDDGTSEISGVSIADDLTNAETVRTYQNILAHEAIEDYWTNETTFTATVTTPKPNATVTNNVAQSADTTSEFASIISPAADQPLEARNGNLELLQAGFFQEGENADRSFVAITESDADASNGQRVDLFDADNPHFVEQDFSTNYDIPNDRQLWGVRFKNRDSSEVPGIAVLIDEGQTGTFTQIFSVGKNWNSRSGWYWESRQNGIGETLDAGNHTLRVEVSEETTNTEEIYIDGFWFGDDKFNWTFDDSVDSNGFLSGPELYPDQVTATFQQESTPWNITDGTLTTTWDDISNNQRIQLRLSGQTWIPNDGTENNTETVTTDFGSEFGTDIQGRARLSRYGSRTTATPTTGFKGQKIQTWEITYDGNDLAIIEDQTFKGSHLQNLQDLHKVADMRFTVLHRKDSKPVESYRAGDVEKSLPSEIRSGKAVNNKIRKKDLSDYANKVTVRSKVINDTFFSTTLQDDSEVNKFGEQLFTVIVPTVDSQADTDAKCRSLLSEKLRERTDKGEIETAPLDVAPGFSYPNQFGSDDSTVPLEETQYQVSNRSVSGRLVFDFRVTDLSSVVGGLRRVSRDIRRGL